mgnify:CR=1 FL=1
MRLFCPQFNSCFSKCRNQIDKWTLYFGRETQSGPNVNEVSRTVSQVIIHPDYNNTKLNNDAALMKLSSTVIDYNVVVFFGGGGIFPFNHIFERLNMQKIC